MKKEVFEVYFQIDEEEKQISIGVFAYLKDAEKFCNNGNAYVHEDDVEAGCGFLIRPIPILKSVFTDYKTWDSEDFQNLVGGTIPFVKSYFRSKRRRILEKV